MRAARIPSGRAAACRPRLRRGAVPALALAIMAVPALALEPLEKEAHINDSLRAGRIGDVIRKNCPTIEARMFTVWLKIEQLKTYARQKGYTEPQVRAFLKDPAQRARIKAEADAWLAAQGAVPGDAESYCRIGRQEIARGTLLGSLMRDRS